jgi:hypothetical protein
MGSSGSSDGRSSPDAENGGSAFWRVVEVGGLHHAVLTGDRRVPMEAGRKAAGHLPEQPARELESCDDRSVDPTRVPDAGGMNP